MNENVGMIGAVGKTTSSLVADSSEHLLAYVFPAAKLKELDQNTSSVSLRSFPWPI